MIDLKLKYRVDLSPTILTTHTMWIIPLRRTMDCWDSLRSSIQ